MKWPQQCFINGVRMPRETSFPKGIPEARGGDLGSVGEAGSAQGGGQVHAHPAASAGLLCQAPSTCRPQEQPVVPRSAEVLARPLGPGWPGGALLCLPG